MKITSPHMGKVDLLLSDLFSRLDACYLPPPKTTTETLRLGVKYAPEFSCLPLKITIGNFIEALDRGADTLIMAGGIGPCRFGYYAQIQERIIRAIGYDFEMVVVEPPGVGIWDFVGAFKSLAPKKSIWQIWQAVKTCFRKAQVLDELEQETLKTRAFEEHKGDTTRAFKKATKILNQAYSLEQINQAREEGLFIINQVPKVLEKEPLKVGIVGEFYVLLEPFVNFDLEQFLGGKGVYIERAVYVTDWIGPSAENPVAGVSDSSVAKAASSYLSHFVGGEGQATVGHIVKFAREGFDGIIHLFPFTCMPETIAKSIFPKMSRELDIPILSLVIDEQTGKAGVVTRLEAFIDLLHSKKRSKVTLNS